MNNYDASQVGVPYVRAHKITIYYPDNGLLPFAEIEQSLAVKLASGIPRQVQEQLPILIQTFDMTDQTPIPLVSPDTGTPLGPSVTLQQVMVSLLAVVRKVQLGGFYPQEEPAPAPPPPEV